MILKLHKGLFLKSHTWNNILCIDVKDHYRSRGNKLIYRKVNLEEQCHMLQEFCYFFRAYYLVGFISIRVGKHTFLSLLSKSSKEASG